MIPFSPPRIDELLINEVIAALKSGWITTGPRTKKFEKNLSAYNGNAATLCVNSATAGMEIMLRWFGVKEGDEVIVPAYTYTATANVVVHCRARPVIVDTGNDFNISIEAIEKAITSKTKVIMPVDFGGYPCNYDAIMSLVKRNDVKQKFNPSNELQKQLGRIFVLSDSAHSLGAIYQQKKTGVCADAAAFSFHAVKNLSTAEGGCVSLNLPLPFDNEEIYRYLCILTLHGQNKDALAKMQKGNWKYDVIEAGFKCNMTDLQAALGLVELARYDNETLIKRKHICKRYSELLGKHQWAELPLQQSDDGKTFSSYHLYPLRIKNINEQQRDAIIQSIFNKDVSVNVHFIPLPLLSFYKNNGYDIKDFPVTYDNYSREISLPVFYDLTDEQIEMVVSAVAQSVEEVLMQKA